MTNPVEFFRDGQWTAGVVGLGYVGLPLLVTTADAGLETIGYDISSRRVDSLLEGRSHVDDVSDEDVKRVLAGHSTFTSDLHELERADAIFICVPSPLGRNRQPDLSHIASAAETVAAVARKGHLVSLESTTYPGTTEDYMVSAVEGAGLTLDEDVYVAFSPERVSPGDALGTGEIPKVVGGVSELSGLVAEAAYGRLVPQVHRVSSARVAEMTKLLENTYRAVNIGLVNEIAQLAHALGIDIWEVIEAASTKPFGFHAFYPGPGVGGHCIPLDPQYLAWRAKETNAPTRFIDMAEQVNRNMPTYVADRAAEILNRQGLSVNGTSILGLGIAYKRDIADDRESASLLVLAELARRGANVLVHDPVVGRRRVTERGLEYVESFDGLSLPLAVVLTDHSSIDYEAVSKAASVVFDTRDVYRRLGVTAGNIETL